MRKARSKVLEAVRAERAPLRSKPSPKGPIERHPVHPALALFPLMDQLELKGLAASIKELGLIHAIVLDGETIIDGRCRLIACRMAGVEPRFMQLPAGKDPVGWIKSANLLRTNVVPPGRRAMMVVMAAGDRVDLFAGHNPRLIKMAREVCDAYPAAVPTILSGAWSLDEVYQRIVQERRQVELHRKSMARLQKEAPSIADLVMTERITLTEGMALLRSRQLELNLEEET
jgi:hypothetical protein